MVGLVGAAPLSVRPHRAKLTSTLRPLAEKLNAAIDKAMAIPGVADKIRPYVQPVRDKLTALLPPAP